MLLQTKYTRGYYSRQIFLRLSVIFISTFLLPSCILLYPLLVPAVVYCAASQDSWPNDEPLDKPIFFKTTTGSNLIITRMKIEQVIGSSECTSSIRIEDDARRKRNVGIPDDKDRIAVELDNNFAIDFVINEIKKVCIPNRISIDKNINLYSIKQYNTTFLYFKSDGSFERRGMQVCGP